MTHIAFKESRLRKVLFLSATFFLATQFACKDDGQLVPDFNSAQLKLNQIVIDVTSSTAAGDSVRTDRVSRSLFGKLNDNSFGLSASEIFSQFLMPSSALNTGDILESDIDSVVLNLVYDDAYGFPYTHEIFVYELDNGLDSSEYYSTQSIAYNPVELGSSSFFVNPSDTVNDTFNVVRILLDTELGRRIVREKEFVDQEAWLNFFKGLRFAPGSADPMMGEGNIVYFNLLHPSTKLTVYFRKADNTEGTFSFVVDGGSQRFAKFDHNQQGTLLEADIAQTTGEVNYLTSMAASYIRMNFNDLKTLHEQLGNIAINKAELIIPFEDPLTPEYDPPTKSVLIVKDEESGDWVLPIDWYKNGSDYFGGSLDQVNREYRFNLASTLHEMLNGGDYDREIFMSVSGNSVSAARLLVNSGNSSNQKRKIYVLLTYTKND